MMPLLKVIVDISRLVWLYLYYIFFFIKIFMVMVEQTKQNSLIQLLHY
jgi:hypothetical protein